MQKNHKFPKDSKIIRDAMRITLCALRYALFAMRSYDKLKIKKISSINQERPNSNLS